MFAIGMDLRVGLWWFLGFDPSVDPLAQLVARNADAAADADCRQLPTSYERIHAGASEAEDSPGFFDVEQ